MPKKIKPNDLADLDQGTILKFLVESIYDTGDDETEKLPGLVHPEFKDRESREKYKNLYYLHGSKIKVDFHNMVDAKIWVRKILDEARVNYTTVGYNRIENSYPTRILVDMDWVKNFNLTNQDAMQLLMKCGVPNYEQREWAVIWGLVELFFRKRAYPFYITPLNGRLKVGMNHILEKVFNPDALTTQQLYVEFFRCLERGDLLERIQEKMVCKRNALGGIIADRGELLDFEDYEEGDPMHPTIISGVKKMKMDRFVSIMKGDRSTNNMEGGKLSAVLVARLLNGKNVEGQTDVEYASVEALRLYKEYGLSNQTLLTNIIKHMVPLVAGMKDLLKEVDDPSIINIDEKTKRIWVGDRYMFKSGEMVLISYDKSKGIAKDARLRYTNLQTIKKTDPFYITFYKPKEPRLGYDIDFVKFWALDAGYKDNMGMFLYDLVKDKIDADTKKLLAHFKFDPEIYIDDTYFEETYDYDENKIYMDRLIPYLRDIMMDFYMNDEEDPNNIRIEGIIYKWYNGKLIPVTSATEEISGRPIVEAINKYLPKLMTPMIKIQCKEFLEITSDPVILSELDRIRNLLFSNVNETVVSLKTLRDNITNVEIYQNSKDFFFKAFFADKIFDQENMNDFYNAAEFAVPISSIEEVFKKPYTSKKFFFYQNGEEGSLWDGLTFFQGKVLKMDFTVNEFLTKILFETALEPPNDIDMAALPIELIIPILKLRKDGQYLLDNWYYLFTAFPFARSETMIFFPPAQKMLKADWAMNIISERPSAIPPPKFINSNDVYEYNMENKGTIYFKSDTKTIVLYHKNSGLMTEDDLYVLLHTMDLLSIEFTPINVQSTNRPDDIYIMFVSPRISGASSRGVKLYNNYEDMIKTEYSMSPDNFLFPVFENYGDGSERSGGQRNLLKSKPRIRSVLHELNNYTRSIYYVDNVKRAITAALKISALKGYIHKKTNRSLLNGSNVVPIGGQDVNDLTPLWLEIENYESIKTRYQ